MHLQNNTSTADTRLKIYQGKTHRFLLLCFLKKAIHTFFHKDKRENLRKVFTQIERHFSHSHTSEFHKNGDLKAILKSSSSRPQVSPTRKFNLLFPEKK